MLWRSVAHHEYPSGPVDTLRRCKASGIRICFFECPLPVAHPISRRRRIRLISVLQWLTYGVLSAHSIWTLKSSRVGNAIVFSLEWKLLFTDQNEEQSHKVVEAAYDKCEYCKANLPHHSCFGLLRLSTMSYEVMKRKSLGQCLTNTSVSRRFSPLTYGIRATNPWLWNTFVQCYTMSLSILLRNSKCH